MPDQELERQCWAYQGNSQTLDMVLHNSVAEERRERLPETICNPVYDPVPPLRRAVTEQTTHQYAIKCSLPGV